MFSRFRAVLCSTLIGLTILSGCTTVPPADAPIEVVIEQPVLIDWGLRQAEAMNYQHAGVPGNFGTIVATNGHRAMEVLVLGEPLNEGSTLTVDVLGSLEQVNNGELITTIIASTGDYQSLEHLEQEHLGALAVLEAGLIKLTGNSSRSLGYRSAEHAISIIRRQSPTQRGG